MRDGKLNWEAGGEEEKQTSTIARFRMCSNLGDESQRNG
jgi:hypothetical protein